MCFSPEADLVGAAVVGVVAVDTIRQVHDRRDRPLAALPAIFAVHLFTEVFVWWSLQGHLDASDGRVATWLYLLIALVVVPVVVPFAVAGSEPDRARRRVMLALGVLGTAVAALLLAALVRDPYSAHIQSHCIRYNVHLAHSTSLTALYVVVTCGALLLSSYRRLVWFGIANLVVVALFALLLTGVFISVWCAWAAITSVVIDLHLRSKRPVAEAPPRVVDERTGVG